MLALLLAASVTQLQIASIYELWISSTDTTLGTFVFSEGLYIRSLIVLATILLSVFVLFEAIQGVIYERQNEFQMYHVMGWTGKMIKSNFLKEVMLWVLLPLIAGTIITLIVSFLIEVSITSIVLGFTFSVITFLVLVLILVPFRKYNFSHDN
mgnify:FL=1